MRNLKLMSSLHWQIDSASNSECMSVDCDTGTVYCATPDTLLGIQPQDGQVSCIKSVFDIEDQDASSKFVAIQYLADEHSLCAATDKGDILMWNILSNEVECVGSVETGITSMTWSPDLELLIITTGADSLIMMTREFDPITETSLHPDQFGEAEFVQVGWGKKETQFHGSVGKEAAKVKREDVKPVLEWDDRKPRVTWRGDGQYFAIGSIHPHTGARKMCTWTREGVHHSTSENVDGVEQSLSWKPSGSLIATSQRRPNKHDIAFYEKNGLRHGEFTLPFDVNQVKVNEVMWNIDSTVLAVWCEDKHNKDNNTSYIQLWTCGNYHWYLKQSLQFTGPGDCISAVLWDPEHAYCLHVMCKNGGYFRYAWSWATAHSGGRTGQDQALVAVIDGGKVLMSPMRSMVVPPPMSAYQLEMSVPVNQVMFAPPPNSNDVALVLEDSRIAIYRFEDTDMPPKEGLKLDAAGGTGFSKCCKIPVLKEIYSITNMPDSSNTKYPMAMSHVTWIDSDVIIFCTVAMTTQPCSILHKARLDGDKIVVLSSCTLEMCVYGIAYDPDSQNVAIQLSDGSILRCITDNDDMSVLPWETSEGEEMRFPVPCIQMSVCEVGGQLVLLGLTERYRFYVNNIEIASNCTSYSVHDEFLLLTTLTHTCRCISRHTKVKDLPTLSDGKAHPFDESIRRVERGSRVVVSVPDDTKLILQMPRGNLETIHPRALVLSAVRKCLDKLEFRAAFTLMRKHRINMNLLYDHNPAVFIQNVQQFVRQVEGVNHINLFLTDLLEEDVTVTMYTAAYHERVTNPDITTQLGQDRNKVDTICDTIRQALCSIDENKYLLSILTTYVRRSKPELEQALQLVKKLRDCENDAPPISAEEVLKYLLFLVDVNELYDISLGTYDFDLVLMVAEKSQKDPKEYIPFLNQLRRLETNYQRFTIDKHLKRYTKALEHITKCGAEHFCECLSLINEHQLHTVALQLYTPGSTEYKEIASNYGDILSGKRRHDEAAIMYNKGENYESALTSYIAAHDWRQTFCMSSRLQRSPEQEVEIARKMADELKSKCKHGEAAIVLEQYAKDSEEAIVTLIQGGLWDESLRLMYKYGRTDFIETDLKSQLQESLDHHLTNLDQMRTEFEKHRSRLVIVRQEKEKARLELMEMGGQGHNQDSDLFSDTSSATGESIQSSRYSSDTTSSSVYSKMSGRSARNRRRAEHKKWRLKEGSEFEDFALIGAMAKTITYVDGLRDEIRSLLRILVQFHHDRQAEELQRQYDSFLSLIDKSIPQIWLDEDTTQEFKPVLGPNTTANTIALAMQQGRGSVQSGTDEQEKLDPVIKFAPVLKKELKWKLYALET